MSCKGVLSLPDPEKARKYYVHRGSGVLCNNSPAIFLGALDGHVPGGAAALAAVVLPLSQGEHNYEDGCLALCRDGPPQIVDLACLSAKVAIHPARPLQLEEDLRTNAWKMNPNFLPYVKQQKLLSSRG